MKLLFTALLALATLVASAQNSASVTASAYAALPKDSASQKVSYVGVVQAPGATQADLFSRAAEWLARQGEQEGEPGAAADPTSGLHIAHLAFKQPPLSFTDTHSNLYIFAVAIYTKPGKYMYRIDDITYRNINPALATKDVLNRVPVESYATVKENKRVAATLADFDKHIKALIESLNTTMLQSKSTPKGW